MHPPSWLGLSGLYCIPKARERTRRVEPSQADLLASLGLEYLSGGQSTHLATSFMRAKGMTEARGLCKPPSPRPFQSQGWGCQKATCASQCSTPFLAAPRPGCLCPALRFPGKAGQASAGKGTADLVGRSPNPLQMGRWLAQRAQLPG